jgi:UDP-N-acetyl-D-mannosaminuronic acid dehydrogenase
MARPAILYDFWNAYDREMLSMAPGTEYVALGSHPVSQPVLVPA